jgi:hypothetical protein
MFILSRTISNVFSQTPDTLKILRLSDSIMTANTSSTLFHYQTRSDVPIAVYTRIPANKSLDNRKINDREYSKKFEISTYMTGYDMKLKMAIHFSLRQILHLISFPGVGQQSALNLTLIII